MVRFVASHNPGPCYIRGEAVATDEYKPALGAEHRNIGGWIEENSPHRDRPVSPPSDAVVSRQ